MDEVNPTRNWPYHSFLRRKQVVYCEDGYDYDFGQPFDKKYFDDKTPAIVRTCIEYARADSKKPGACYMTALVNLYPDGKAGVMPHADDEEGLDNELPIYSFTVYKDGTSAKPRLFSVYRMTEYDTNLKEKSPACAETPLEHGSLFIMEAGMQQRYLHSVNKITTVKYSEYGPRINITLRPFLDGATSARPARKVPRKK